MAHKGKDENVIKTAFDMLDQTGSGKLTKEDLRKGFQVFGHNPTVRQVDEIMSELGISGDIDYHGFERCMKALESEHIMQGEKELREAFSVFDKDGNGYIDRKELACAMKELGEQFNDKEVDEMFKIADSDADGKIKYEEFLKIMTK